MRVLLHFYISCLTVCILIQGENYKSEEVFSAAQQRLSRRGLLVMSLVCDS
jgi:hypothetical protein